MTLDSREELGIDVTALQPVVGPNGQYHTIQKVVGQYTRYEQNGFFIYLDHKIDRKSQEEFEMSVKQQIEKNYPSELSL